MWISAEAYVANWRGNLMLGMLFAAYFVAGVLAEEPQPSRVSQAPPLLVPEGTSEAQPAAGASTNGPVLGPAQSEPRPSEPAAMAASPDPPDAFTPSSEFQEWITAIVREQLPHDYEKKKNWGHQAKTFDGLSVRIENGQLKTHRKFKQANDGSWQMYRVTLKDPEEKFDVKIANIRQLPSGKVGLDITAVASLEVFGRQSLWEHGVQLFSLSAEADARVKLWAQAEVATRMDLTRFPPDVILDPEITAARFEIPDFRMRRIGRADGPLVRSLSHTAREALEEKLADDNAKLVAKLNRAIAKQEKKLKLSLADVMTSKWSGLLGQGATGDAIAKPQ
jgi:hypothetical protein